MGEFLKKYNWLYILLLLILITPQRMTALDEFATVDEPWWVISGSNYYYALTHHDFTNTIYDYHPAVTTTWVVAAGMFSYFPEYRGLGQGYFDVRKPLFEDFMREQGKDPLILVQNSRFIQSALLIALALIIYFLLKILTDEKVAFFSTVLAMNAPFFLGHSRLLNHEAMLAMFALTSTLSALVYIKKRALKYLVISGVFFGFAQLTKSSSIVLVILMGMLLLLELFQTNEKPLVSRVFSAIKTFTFWLFVALLTYFLFWPGMWVSPGKMLYEVYGNAFSYAFQGARLDVTKELQPDNFKLVSAVGGVFSYVKRWFSSSTPITWLGLIFSSLIFIYPEEKKSHFFVQKRFITLSLVVFAVLFILLFGVAQGRDSAHYIVSSFVAFDLVAGLGWMYALSLWHNQSQLSGRINLFVPLMTALLILQTVSSLSFFPYYYTYKNPLLTQGGVHGYGEGLDQAAKYLSQKPNPEELKVLSYAARGCFSYFFPGEVELLKIGFDPSDNLPFVEDIEKADYLVLYPVVQNNKPDGHSLLQLLQNVSPEHLVFVDGVETARIYKIASIPPDIYSILNKK